MSNARFILLFYFTWAQMTPDTLQIRLDIPAHNLNMKPLIYIYTKGFYYRLFVFNYHTSSALIFVSKSPVNIFFCSLCKRNDGTSVNS